MSERYAAVEVAGVHKTFHVPKQHVHTLKERALHPFRRTGFIELEALREISFQIGGGEFFGIVGRNGSGKSTLLKLLAGIYKADSGSIKVAGRLAPFIELGVGFNPDLTAVDNVVLNAVMMGLSPREARARFDDVIAFAELGAFLDMKLKNYSSGMQVRLAFSVMVQADADVLLIDEVLAVGDAAFQQKCFDAFYRLRDEGKTLVLVTHDMAIVERFCHRALLLDRGGIDLIGPPGEVARRYLEVNFDHMETELPPEAPATAAKLSDAWLGGEDGRRLDAVSPGERLVLNVELDVLERVEAPAVMLWLETREGARLFFTSSLASGPAPEAFEPGERVHLRVRVRAESALRSGRYFIGASLARGVPAAEVVFHHPHAGDFTVTGDDHGGLLMLEHEVELERGLERIPR